MSAHPPSPRVSVLMPTYRQAAFIRRALESLRAQELREWELIIIDDGSDDDTRHVIEPYLADPRIRYHRLERNRGLGNALNLATSMARAPYIAYLPSDDIYFSQHLSRQVALLDSRPEVYLAYGGLRYAAKTPGRGAFWYVWREWPTLVGEQAAGQERETLESIRGRPEENNLLALVQAVHRRSLEAEIRWAPREEIVSDRLEPDFWWGLLSKGATFAYSGETSVEWTNHPDSRHEIISNPSHGGLSRYRQHYRIPQGEALNWQPSMGLPVDERVTYSRWREKRQLPAPGGLKILIVGDLGFNPERIVAFEEAGHKLYGLWARPESWDTGSTTAFGNIETIPTESDWRARVREIQPDIIYGLLNWQAVPLIDSVLEANLGIPVAFHFKESGFFCIQKGLWPALMRIFRGSDGQIFINEESFEWLRLATDGMLKRENALILDGDLIKKELMTDDWAPKLSEKDGQMHTVCSGRPMGLDPRTDAKSERLVMSILQAGIHVHLYGSAHFFLGAPPEFLEFMKSSGLVHFHPQVSAESWVRELSQYDAAWCHIFESQNHGELRRASWDDFNLPARLGTYAAAGLPWLLKENRGSQVAVNNLARTLDVGLFFNMGDDLAQQLRDRPRLRQLTENMRKHRDFFTFDAQLPRLVSFFRECIERRKRR
jgi:glycosyltransferase involved in cell wall biosynthesis